MKKNEENIKETEIQNNLEMLSEYLKQIEAGDKSSEIYYCVFELYFELSDKKMVEKYADLTMSAAREEISLNKNPENAYICMAKICEYRKDNKNMFFFINKAIEINPQSPDLYLVRAEFYKKTKNQKMAEKDYKAAIELDPSYEEYVTLLKSSQGVIDDSKKLLIQIYLFAIFMIIWLVYIFLDIFFDISKYF